MTQIIVTKKFEKDLHRVPEHTQVKVAVWVELAEMSELVDLRKIAGFLDEALEGKRAGQRSIGLGKSYRLIYREVKGVIEIILLEVNHHG